MVPKALQTDGRSVPSVSLTQSSSTLMSMLFSLFDTPILSQNSLIAAAGYPGKQEEI
jgi:hypothetical protein